MHVVVRRLVNERGVVEEHGRLFEEHYRANLGSVDPFILSSLQFILSRSVSSLEGGV